MTLNLKTLATYAMAASLPTLAVAQTTTQPARQTTPPAMTSSPTATPQSSARPSMTQSDAAQAMHSRRASKLIGANIYNEENTDIGEVQDLMISANNPTIAVLSVGGFLGIGDRYVAVPLSELHWNGDRERWTMRGATVESLKARPAFTFPENS